MTKSTFYALFDVVGRLVEGRNNKAAKPVVKLLIAIRILAGGSFQRE